MGSVLITGATSGIGEAFARQYAAKNSHLLLVARSQEMLRSLAERLAGSWNIRVDIFPLDLSDTCSAERLVAFCREKQLAIDILVNNAGFGLAGPFSNAQAEEIENMVNLHNLTMMKLSSLLLPDMLKRGQGGIINVSSITAFQGVPFNAVYAATKAFTLSLSEALHEELKGSGVHVCAVCPGLTKTPLFEKTGVDPHKTLLPVGDPAPVVKAAIKALERNKPLVVPGLVNKILIHGGRLLPRSLMVRMGVLLARNQTSDCRRPSTRNSCNNG
ncbi:MAG TPA: SDR family oxidoreductase [Prosthecochloris aestuarii]|uniref:SDR family oxidoreductase n=1 Tax=Prosthecochloris aestuarii TaxID=1102 RepID=A0A831SQJ9_PROAE|nr:SDR family oxidoreductase [Prosthecochloris aestuarii]